MQTDVVQIDIISDCVCPWCFVGKRQLDKALAEDGGGDVRVFWRPFELNEGMPAEGRDRAEHYRMKFGDTSRLGAMTDNLKSHGAALDIAFDFEAIERVPNTVDAHRLIRWAQGQGKQDAAAEALFRAYFEDARDIGDKDVLTGIARDIGLDAELVAGLLAGDQDIAGVRQEMAQAKAIGVTGVPCFIFDGRFAVVGAQPAEVFREALAKARAEKNTPAG